MLTVRISSAALGIKSSDQEDKVQVAEDTVRESGSCCFSFHIVRKAFDVKMPTNHCFSLIIKGFVTKKKFDLTFRYSRKTV